MLRSFLIGLVAGSAMTPLAAVSEAARKGELPRDSGAPHWLGGPIVAAGLKALAAVGAAYLTFGARMQAMRRFGQSQTGVIEDALTVGAAQWIMAGARDRYRR